ncbi:unnamed protein product [Pedinophyceae sp. YPF-701]|nr:unnamed protein product [Pedinophyceae sp. YPF-701]
MSRRTSTQFNRYRAEAARDYGVGADRKGSSLLRDVGSIRTKLDDVTKRLECNTALESESAEMNEHLVLQVAALQKGFNMLADAVVEQLEAVRDESSRWPEERRGWVRSMDDLRKDMQRRMDGMHAKYEESLGALERAWQENQGLRSENDVLHHRLSELEAQSKQQGARVERVVGAMGDLRGGLDDMRAATQDLATKVEAREAIHRGIGRAIADLEAKLKGEVDALGRDAAEEDREIKRQLAEVAAEVKSLDTHCRQLDTAQRDMSGALGQRVTVLERGPDLEPVAAALRAMEARVSGISQQSIEASRGVQEALGRMAREQAASEAVVGSIEAKLASLRRAVQEHHDALVRSSKVFAEALHISVPVSQVALAATIDAGRSDYGGARGYVTGGGAGGTAPTPGLWPARGADDTKFNASVAGTAARATPGAVFR